MSSLRRIASILALAAAGALLAGCGGGTSGGSTQTAGTTTVPAPPQTTTSSRGGRAPLDPAKTYEVAFKTNEGSFTVTLDQKVSPKNTASIAALVRKGFFDGTIFHRIVPGFLIQGGDPTGKGTGGPGYTVDDPVPRATHYTRGIVAMAKRSDEPAGTGGSQFFIVTAADLHLPPLYAVIGRVTSGMPTVLKISRLGNLTTEKPTKRVEIEKAQLTTR